jgi:CheY-like chemotaxis protein
MLLTIYGHECRAARSGQEALEVADEFIPEVVILDIGMPDISGYDVARELRARANAQGRRLHLVALTGWGQPADRTRAFDAGFDQHVIKPADAAKLKQIIRIAETGGCERAAITADVHA